jgi:hypothetical protein
MANSTTRRQFLQTAAVGGALLSLADFELLRGLPRVGADEARPNPRTVAFRPEIEPLVRLLEETPRSELLERVAARIRAGATYTDVLAALLLAGIRNVQPRPAVGFKFHAVLVVNSAHLASMASPDEHRWLPIFWALDYFKVAQEEDRREGDWTMPAVDESRLPAADKARAAFVDAMDRWDEEAADAAAAALARTGGANELFDLFCRYGCRDFRSIGHKAIYVANGWRTLQCIGWQHAEPVLRSLAYALLNHQGEPNPAQSDLDADRPGRRNAELARKFRPDWTTGRIDRAATLDMLGVLRSGSADDACDKVLELISSGVHPQSIWDALFLGGGELLFRQRGIVALHALTSTNALHYAYQACGDDATRRLLLLQNAAFLPLFREGMRRRGQVQDFAIEQLEPVAAPANPSDAVADIFRDVSRNRLEAARKVVAAVSQGVSAQQLINAGRLLVFFKGDNSHDYKFSSAVLEDYYHVSPDWRDRFLAAGVFNLRGSEDRDNALIRRARAALQG